MSKSSKSKADKQMEAQLAQFCGVTGASVKDAKKFLEKYKRVDIAVDAFFNDPTPPRGGHQSSNAPSTSKLNALFETYKDPDGDQITVDGTMKLCEDLGVELEDVVLLAIAYELKSPGVGQWNKAGWTDGWKGLGCDSITTMKPVISRLRDKLGADATYFQQVYNYTFDFARSEGQRSIAIDVAQAFWGLLLPHGLSGGALSHIHSTDDDEDDDMGAEEGWKEEYMQWWFDYLTERGGKGVSKDTWMMFLEFVRTIDARFENYDAEGSWPSSIDDFVEYAKERLAKEA